jgi:shikimate kinase
LRRVFLIGPAGVGKSTCGALLAPKLGFGFVDLDSEFNTRVGHIAEFIARKGYLAYCRRNVDLFDALLAAEEESGAVYALSSGFLLYEDLDPSYARLADDLRTLGVSILLLPAASVEEAAEITVGRLLARRPGLDAEKERAKFRTRFNKYIRHGDIQIISNAPPAVTVERAMQEYERFLARAARDRSASLP